MQTESPSGSTRRCKRTETNKTAACATQIRAQVMPRLDKSPRTKRGKTLARYFNSLSLPLWSTLIRSLVVSRRVINIIVYYLTSNRRTLVLIRIRLIKYKTVSYICLVCNTQSRQQDSRLRRSGAAHFCYYLNSIKYVRDKA